MSRNHTKSAENGGETSGDYASLLSLGPSVFLFGLSAFCNPSDLLSLRATCTQLLHFFHRENESDEFWKLMLERDFGFDRNETDDPKWWNKSLGMKPLSPNSSVASLFGFDPWREPDKVVVEKRTAFESWKRWRKSSARFILAPPSGSAMENVNRHGIQVRFMLIRAPYFLRAARFWQRLSRWSRTCRIVWLPRTFSASRGMAMSDWLVNFPDAQSWPGLQACFAIFSFCRGQERSTFPGVSGLMGSYQAYGYVSSTWLRIDDWRQERVDGVPHPMVAADILGEIFGVKKVFRVHGDTGSLSYQVTNSAESSYAIQNRTCRLDDSLVWLEEHMRRLETGQARAELVSGLPGHGGLAITLYPQFPETLLPPTFTEGISVVSRAVTRGVEAIGSAIFVPQLRDRFGFIYSIRLKLLKPGEAGYMAPSERGFETCQLISRHWRITDDSTGHTNRVDGDGVIGMYPLLREGAVEMDGDELDRDDGIFQYQSCTGAMSRGSFGGHLRFVPGSLQSPTGQPFDVELRPFELNDTPLFLY